MLSHNLSTNLQNGDAEETSASPVYDADLSEACLQLANIIQQTSARNPFAVSPEALQTLMSALCRSYGLHADNGNIFLPASETSGLTATEVMTVSSGLLRAANLAVFELGMWQSWSGR